MYKSAVAVMMSVAFGGLALVGCSDSGGGSKDPALKTTVLDNTYDEKAGDEFEYMTNLETHYSNDNDRQTIWRSIKTYSQTDEIPTKYAYSNSVAGPYILETTRKDGVLDRLKFTTPTGDTLVNDDLKRFSTVDHKTVTGSEDVDNIAMGDSVKYTEDAMLFDSESGEEAGYKTVNMEMTVLNTESLALTAGEFNAVRMQYSYTSVNSRKGVEDTETSNGFAWFDTDNGYMLKMDIADGYMTLNGGQLTATYTSETTLQRYIVAPDESAATVSMFLERPGVTAAASVNAVVDMLNNVK